ncbi:hypothetical protein K1728_09545 [Weissella confusa]|uniref:hypothetical protein n=1 Tax=Weissella confusa TaxID=1583 RepID=UPI00189BEF29|nr:hypothetical protein [Weissella confusa]QYU57390.1 hypothetical protein K1728_09545 [Weissella confusa]
MKKMIVIVVVLIVAFAAGVFGYQTMSKNKQYSSDIRNAHAALKQRDWESARQFYKASQKQKVSVEARTALEQLDFAISADKKADKSDWQEALSLYKSATTVDGAIKIVNKNVKVAMQEIKLKRDSVKHAAISSKAKASSEAAASVAEAATAASKAAYSSSVAAAHSATTSSSVTSSSQSSSSDSDSPERQIDSKDIATARGEWAALGYDVANLSSTEIQAAMNNYIDARGGLTMDQIAQQMGWTKQ